MSYHQVPTKLKRQDSYNGLQDFLISSSTAPSTPDCVCSCHLGFPAETPSRAQSHLRAAALTLFTSNALPQGLYRLPLFLKISAHSSPPQRLSLTTLFKIITPRSNHHFQFPYVLFLIIPFVN